MYDPANHHGHAGEFGALTLAVSELRSMKRKANFPGAFTSRNERQLNSLANRLTKLNPSAQ